MLLPDRDDLQLACARLLAEPYDSTNLGGYASAVLALGREIKGGGATTALQFVLHASSETVVEFHGEPALELNQVALLRVQLGEVHDRLAKQRLILPDAEIRRLRELLIPEEDEPRPQTHSSSPGISVSSASVSMLSSRRNRLPTLTDSMGEGIARPGAVQYDSKGRPIHRPDTTRHLFCAALFGVVILLGFEAFAPTAPVWLKACGALAGPLLFLLFTFVITNRRIISAVLRISIVTAIFMTLGLGTKVALDQWRRHRVQEGARLAEARLEQLAIALTQFHGREKVFPRDPIVLFSEDAPLARVGIPAEDFLRDPFADPPARFEYERTLDGVLLRSIGPAARLIPLSWPLSSEPSIAAEDLANATYDPTNGLLSDGNILHIARPKRSAGGDAPKPAPAK
jgi:hypothetical protein